VREKRGLVYSVGSSYRALRDLGAVFVYAGTTAARAQETMDVCLGEIGRLAQTITEEELERGKNILLGRLLSTGELAEHRVGSIAEDLYLRGRIRPVDEVAEAIRAVTLDEVRAHLTAHPPEPLTTLVLGPSSLEVRT
jgi:predicted Zn-dependent peptidase